MYYTLSRLQSLFRRVVGFAVVGFERVTAYVRCPSVRPMYVTKLRMFGALDGVRAPRHGPNCAQKPHGSLRKLDTSW